MADLGELTPEEEGWLDADVEEFLIDLETTVMTKMYKISTIGAFIQEGQLLASVTSTEIGRALQRVYEVPRFLVDRRDNSSRGIQHWPLDRCTRPADNHPILSLFRRSPLYH